MIEFKNVSFSYDGKTKNISNLTTVFKENKITGLVGRNGSGKTTLLSLIATLLKIDEGSLLYNNDRIFENEKVLEEITYIINMYPFNGYATLKRVFKSYAKFDQRFNLEKALKLLKVFGLSEKTKTNKLSRGETSVIHAIKGLAIDTKIIIFDEVELGMDLEKKQIFYEQLLLNQQEKKRTIIISTNVFSETKEIFDDVKIIHENKIIVDENYEKLLDSYVVYTCKDLDQINNLDYKVIEENDKYIKVLIKNANNLVTSGITYKPTFELLFDVLTRNEVKR